MLTFKTIAFVVLALVVGFFGSSFVFSDLGPGESATNRVIVATIFFLFCGLVIGFFNPKVWMMAGLCSWGSVMFGLGYTWGAIGEYDRGIPDKRHPPFIVFGLLVLLGPLCLSLLGGFAGKVIRERRTKP
jgi:hypothetical protein